MADMETLEVEADVSEASIAKITVGQPAEIQLDAFPELRLIGEVSRIVPTVDRSKATLLVKVKFVERDPRVLPDMSSKIAFLSRPLKPDERTPVAALRPDAIVKRDGKDVVFVVGKDDQVKLTPVAVGAKVGDLVRVDLAPGTRVVIAPTERSHGRCNCDGSEEVAMDARAHAAHEPRALVEIAHLSKGYVRGDQQVPVLTDINLTINERDFVAMMGPSGSGKSTLLNLIAGIDKPDAGSLLIAGEDITQFNDSELADWRARTVGFVFQFYNLMPVLTAFENVELPLQLTSLSRAERRERVDLLMSMVGLSDRSKHYPNELSGGQQQRVAIARALVTDPLLVIADEPTGDLDRQSAADILSLLDRLNLELGKTIVMVTHDPRAAEAAHHLIYLDKGQLTDTVPSH